tara:strand:+ start:302 stop:511 length:210 start_codon:yes stop_codon:yes gene_type:complete
MNTNKDLIEKLYELLVSKYAREILDRKCSLELAAKKISYKIGANNIFLIEEDLVDKVKEVGYISQTKFI